MLAFDIWLWAGDFDLTDLQNYSTSERVAIIVMPFMEFAGVAVGLWMVFAKPSRTK